MRNKELLMHHPSTSARRRGITAGAILGVAALVAVIPATAAYAADNHIAIDFDAYELGVPKGQNGWGSHTNRTYDFEIVDADGRALRLSNATNNATDYGQMSQLFAPRLPDKAGEPQTGAPNDVFELNFTVESTTGGYQPELNISVAVSGERSDGAQPQNRAGGLVNLTHIDGQLAIWTTWPAEGTDLADWRNAGIRVAPDQAHTVTYVVQFVDGDANDVASLWVDGQLVSDQLSSWENYHDNAEAFAKQNVEGPLFRISRSLPTEDGIGYGTADYFADDIAEALLGEGFLIRDLEYATYQSTPTTAPPASTEPAEQTEGMAAEAEASGDTVAFEASGFDPFENVAITVYSTPYFAGWFRADAQGVVAGTLTLPAGFPGGTHTIELAGANGNVALAQFSLARLPATGPAETAVPLLAGAGLLLLVGAALAGVRMRRNAA